MKEYSNSQISAVIDEYIRDPSEIIPVIDELMTTLQVLHPRLYDGVLNKL